MESSDNTELNRVYIWANNRSLTTVLLKCLSHIPDCQIVNGLFTSCFLFGQDPTSKQPSCSKKKYADEAARYDLTDFPNLYEGSTTSYPWAKRQLQDHYPGKKYLIAKDLAFAMSGNYGFIPSGFRHTFIIRHPYRMFQSWKTSSLVDYLPTSNLYDLITSYCKNQFNYKEQYEVLQYLQDHPTLLGGHAPVVIDADDLQNHPASILSQYCKAVGLPYSDRLLQWNPGFEEVKTWRASRQLVTGGIYGHETGRGFWSTAMASSQFLPGKKLPDRSALSDDVLACADISMPYYDALNSLRTIGP